MENKNVKSIIIIASGGLDSTTLIWKAMSEKIQIKRFYHLIMDKNIVEKLKISNQFYYILETKDTT